MEWTELQALWQQQDARIAESTRINKEILKRMIRKNSEKRLKWMKFWAAYGMIVPISVVCIALVSNIKFRNEWDFYLGLILLVITFTIDLYHTYQYYLSIRDINFTNQVAKTKKQLIQVDKLKRNISKWGFLTFLVALPGVCLIAQLPVINLRFVIFIIFITLFAMIKYYIHLKRFKKQLSSFNAELNEIEQLEKE